MAGTSIFLICLVGCLLLLEIALWIIRRRKAAVINFLITVLYGLPLAWGYLAETPVKDWGSFYFLMLLVGFGLQFIGLIIAILVLGRRRP